MEITEIIERMGGVVAGAKALGVHHTSITGWKQAGRVPVKRAQQINALFDIPLYDVRPDVWPPPLPLPAELIAPKPVPVERAA